MESSGVPEQDPGFELGEDVSQLKNPEQERAWARAEVDGRAHWSHREMAHVHAARIKESILDYERIETLWRGLGQPSSMLYQLGSEILQVALEHAIPGQAECLSQMDRHAQLHKDCPEPAREFEIRVVARKRPLLPFELEAGEYDCIGCEGREAKVHDGKLARNGRRIDMTHHRFGFDSVYGERASNRRLFEAEVRPLLESALSGASATLLCYGQTGTGKTHTMMGLLQEVARASGGGIRLQSFELTPSKKQELFDLLSDERKPVEARADENDRVHVRGAVSVEVEGPEHFGGLLRRAADQRKVRVTERNPISSRSHWFCQLHFASSGGLLTFVDLAGCAPPSPGLLSRVGSGAELRDGSDDCSNAPGVGHDQHKPDAPQELLQDVPAAARSPKAAAAGCASPVPGEQAHTGARRSGFLTTRSDAPGKLHRHRAQDDYRDMRLAHANRPAALDQQPRALPVLRAGSDRLLELGDCECSDLPAQLRDKPHTRPAMDRRPSAGVGSHSGGRTIRAPGAAPRDGRAEAAPAERESVG